MHSDLSNDTGTFDSGMGGSVSDTGKISQIHSTIADYTGLRPIYVIFFEFLPISFQMKNNDDMRLCLK